jgi:hypothetical protein
MSDHDVPRGEEPAATYRSAFDGIGAELDAMAGQLHEIPAAVRDLTARIRLLTDEVTSLRAQLETLQGRFAQLLAEEHERRRPGTMRPEDLEFYEVGDDLHTFFKQLSAIAREATSTGTSPEDRAVVVCELMNVLVGPAANRQRLVGVLAASSRDAKWARLMAKEIEARFAAIEKRANGLGRDGRWEVVDSSSRRIDPSSQEPWLGCDADDEVVFTVTPAYRVGPKLLVKAQVFTRPPAP